MWSVHEIIYALDKVQITPIDFLCLDFHYLNSSCLVAGWKPRVAEFFGALFKCWMEYIKKLKN